MHKLFVLFLSIMLSGACVLAWETPKDDDRLYYWCMGGFGTTAQEWSKIGTAAGMEIGVQSHAHIFLFRWNQNNEADPGTVGEEAYDLHRTPEEDINEVGLLYGRGWRNDLFVLSAAAGVTYISGMRRGDLIQQTTQVHYDGGTVIEKYEERPFETVGLPVIVQISFQALEVFGFAVELFGNANPERSYMGALLGIQFGHLR
ncbi:hypothetical protein KKC97_13065 [bacterium]|nr:hypothetical protein [bacterium]MBU1638586.1 hypothetical protein [bacterium]